jgi:hypothetical protein
MGGGGSRGAQPGYNEIEYSPPWPGLQLDNPANFIDPGACVSCSATVVNGRLTSQPALYPVTQNGAVSAPSFAPVVLPSLGFDEAVSLIINVPIIGQQQGYTALVTGLAIYTDYLNSQTIKTFTKAFTFPTPYNPAFTKFCSVVIGTDCYISSAQHLGVYKLSIVAGVPTVTEISAQNGSGPFIGADFMCTANQRLVLGNIIGGDGNTTGTATGVDVTVAGSGYPASGTFTIVGGGGSGASGTYTTSGGAFLVGNPSTSFTFTDGGENYVPNSGAQIALSGTPGTGFVGTLIVSSAVTPSTTTRHPDYFAWSFANAFGQLDANNTITPGGFDQLTEARGIITGFSVFQAVIFVGHGGGITEVTPNTTSNITPWTYNPLWSADQGTAPRYGTMTQWGDLSAFLGYDTAYSLSPSGLTPIGGHIDPLLQNLQRWSAAGANSPLQGLFGSIVQMDGEKHYLIQAVNIDSGTLPVGTTVFDLSFKTGCWHTWNYGAIDFSGPVYQSYDTQAMGGGSLIYADNWILVPLVNAGSIHLLELAIGSRLLALNGAGVSPIISQTFSYNFRCETPASARMNQERRVVIEYENIPQLAGTSVTLNLTLTGQNSPSLSNVNAMTQQITFAATLVYPSTPVQPGQILTVQTEPVGPAFVTCGSMMTAASTGLLNIVRIAQINELQKGEIQ